MTILQAKTSPIDKAAGRLSSILDRQAYEEISRNNPELADVIVEFVAAGESPDQIMRRVLYEAPQRWPLAQAVRQAARWVEANRSWTFIPSPTFFLYYRVMSLKPSKPTLPKMG